MVVYASSLRTPQRSTSAPPQKQKCCQEPKGDAPITLDNLVITAEAKIVDVVGEIVKSPLSVLRVAQTRLPMTPELNR